MTYNVSSGTLNPTIPYHTKVVNMIFSKRMNHFDVSGTNGPLGMKRSTFGVKG